MSAVPRELRNRVVRKLERAIADRDQKLNRVRRDADQLHGMLGNLEGQLQQQAEFSRQLEKEIAAAERELAREQKHALKRLQQLRQEMERQHQRLEAALREAEERHRREWQKLQQEIEQLAHERREKERRLRQQARSAAERAREVLASVDPAEAEAMDLAGNLAAAAAQLDSAVSLLSDSQALPTEQISAALGAEDAALQLRGLVGRRRALLGAFEEELAAAADQLEELVEGKATGELDDQRRDVDDLLAAEAAEMRVLIDRHLRQPAGELQRWNGHGALYAKLSGVRDLLVTEIVDARRCLGAAVAHDEGRYVLEHVWDDLELRFGRIRDLGEDTEGAWSDPGDRKSSYLYFLDSPSGEVQVEVPWVGPLTVVHEGRRLLQLPLSSDRQEDPEVLWIGGLRQRWQQLDRRLQNPNWDPDLSLEE